MTNYDYLYDKNFFGGKLEQNHFSAKKLHFRIIRNGTILPHIDAGISNGFGGVIDEKGEFVKGTFVHRNTGDVYTPNGDVHFENRTVIYFGMIISIWGHNITDNLTRAWFFRNEILKRYFRNCPVVYTNMWGGQS